MSSVLRLGLRALGKFGFDGEGLVGLFWGGVMDGGKVVFLKIGVKEGRLLMRRVWVKKKDLSEVVEGGKSRRKC
jgi:hypothetical protein